MCRWRYTPRRDFKFRFSSVVTVACTMRDLGVKVGGWFGGSGRGAGPGDWWSAQNERRGVKSPPPLSLLDRALFYSIIPIGSLALYRGHAESSLLVLHCHWRGRSLTPTGYALEHTHAHAHTSARTCHSKPCPTPPPPLPDIHIRRPASTATPTPLLPSATTGAAGTTRTGREGGAAARGAETAAAERG